MILKFRAEELIKRQSKQPKEVIEKLHKGEFKIKSWFDKDGRWYKPYNFYTR